MAHGGALTYPPANVKDAPLQPRVQVFVCGHARAADDPLRSGCGEAGPAVFAALKRATLTAGASHTVWITRTGCMGLCPPRGCSVAVEPAHRHYVEVTAADVPALLQSLRAR
jgi:(2Fe-2S) ferredoxin